MKKPKPPQDMPPPAPSAAAVSALAGVSTATVSRALRNDPRISRETTRRVAAAAERLGYRPNAMARGLATRRSGVIGFVVSGSDNYYYQEQLEVVAELVAARGRALMLFQVAQDGDLQDVLPSMLDYRLEGAIVISSVPASPASLEECARHGIPLALINRPAEGPSAVVSILCDQFEGGREIARFLTAGGHRRIALVAARGGVWTTREREAGVLAGLAEAGLAPVARCEGDSSFWTAHEAVLALLAEGPAPDAFVALTDLMAFGVMDALRRAGKRVPEEVSVVGFNNSRTAAWPSYDLTSFSQPLPRMLDRAMEMLVRFVPGEGPSETLTIPGELVIRGSARVP